MYVVQNVTTNATQTQNIILPNGNSVSITIYFSLAQIGWFITNLTYGTFVLNGLRIVNSPNLLYQFQNQIPFGLACISNGNIEPTQQQSFSSGNSVLYILDQGECAEYSGYLSLGII